MDKISKEAQRNLAELIKDQKGPNFDSNSSSSTLKKDVNVDKKS